MRRFVSGLAAANALRPLAYKYTGRPRGRRSTGQRTRWAFGEAGPTGPSPKPLPTAWPRHQAAGVIKARGAPHVNG